MCGIWASIGADSKGAENSLEKLRARGPEGSRCLDLGKAMLGFTRLAINGLTPAGMQPMADGYTTWVCNGEIYNWRALAKEYGLETQSGSDCEIIGTLYNRFLTLGMPLGAVFRALDGVFAIVIVDRTRDQVIVARDPYGVRPLYSSVTPTAHYYASELKALPEGLWNPVYPGSYHRYCLSTGGLKEVTAYHNAPIYKQPLLGNVDLACQSIRAALESAVKKRMMTERPIAALLSGGLDSSLIASLLAKGLKDAGAPPLKTFSIGMPGSSDLAHARIVADWIGSDHTEVVLSADEFFDAIHDVIYSIESYDTTTVRASVGNWLVGKAIKDTDCKVVFNGDGADEVWGSYLYFYGAPSDAAYEEEVTRLLEDIHYFDVLRSDRCISSHGLEPRTPYLDKEFVAAARAIPTSLRRPGPCCEKWLIREAFNDGVTLPKEVLFRRKEAFSDGVSGAKAWFEIAQEKAAALGFTEKEYYQKIYEGIYGKQAVNVPYVWMPKWCDATDPSARTLPIYSA
jgi:asparagine synthase (glutamine-hydrolysing)